MRLRLFALAFYHTLQEPRLSRKLPRLCAYLRETCPKEREPKEEISQSRRAPNQFEVAKLSDLIRLERDPSIIGYSHTEPGTQASAFIVCHLIGASGVAAQIRAKRPLLDDVSIAYFEVLVLDAGTMGTVAVRSLSILQSGALGLDHAPPHFVVSDLACLLQVGLVANDHPLTQMPGWRPNSFGYHGDDGNKCA